jgi:hypothetical protein
MREKNMEVGVRVVFWRWKRICSRDVELLPWKVRPPFSKSKGCRGHALGSDWLFTFTYFIGNVPIKVGISPSFTLLEKRRPPRLPMRENLQCAISRG